MDNLENHVDDPYLVAAGLRPAGEDIPRRDLVLHPAIRDRKNFLFFRRGKWAEDPCYAVSSCSSSADTSTIHPVPSKRTSGSGSP